MEKPLSHKNTTPESNKPEQFIEDVSFSEQGKNIQEVFRLCPELRRLAYESVEVNQILSKYVIELRGHIRNRLRQEGLSEEKINELTKTQDYVKENPEVVLSQVTNVDINSLISNYTFNKEEQLQQYEMYKDKYKENADIVPEIGASISRDTSWWDDKISELKKGSPEQAEKLYAEYLKTIFPESKVQNIVWHGTNKKFEVFDKKYIGSSTDEGSYGKGFYFSDRQRLFGEFMMPNVLNLCNPLTSDPTTFYEFKNNKPDFSDIENFENYKGDYIYPTPELITQTVKESGFDGVVLQAEQELDPNSHMEYIVFEPNQIHILGSKTDIEKFKEFIAKK